MSGPSVVSDISTTLLELLKVNMSNLVAQDHISLSSPAEIVQDTTPRLGLFLYQLLENNHLKNSPPQSVTANRMQIAALALDAFYLLTAYAQTREIEHQILGRAIQIFNDHRIIRGTFLRGGLAGSDEEVKIVFHMLSIDDTNKLWNMFGNRPYKLSVAYRLSLALIDSSREIAVDRTIQSASRYGFAQSD